MCFTCSLTQYIYLLCNRLCQDLTLPGWRLPLHFPFDIYTLGVLGKVHCINLLLFCAGYKGKTGFLGGYLLKNLPEMQGMRVWFLGWEYPLEKESATHFSILTWEIPWTEEPGVLQSMGSHAAAAAKLLQSCPTLCDPIDRGPPGSCGILRQEHWSGSPFPSPVHESEKWKWSRSVMSDS